jgi:7-carboxy-7-deazaguanine synthase
MSKVIIEANPSLKRALPFTDRFINVSEFFCDTIQGENFVGWPSAFLRVQHCTMNCKYCDTLEVWRFGNPYTFDELFRLIEEADLIRKFKEGQRLVLTGGSPLLQQDKLILFLHEFIQKYKFKPYIEIENEAAIMPKDEFFELIDCWNNSPKLQSSCINRNIRFQPAILKKLSSLKNSWFKFVVSLEEDWKEIREEFLDTGLIKKRQVVLMPLGATRDELSKNREFVLNMAVRENVRYSTREHIVLWDKKTGV